LGVGGNPSNYPFEVNTTVSRTIGSSVARTWNCGAWCNSWTGGTVTDNMSLFTSGSIVVSGSLYNVSDQRLKNFLQDLTPSHSLEAVNQLEALYFTWKPEAGQGDGLNTGFFAQQVDQFIPEAVSIYDDKIPGEYHLNYNVLTTYALSAIKGLSDKVNATNSAYLNNLAITDTGDLNITQDNNSTTGRYKLTDNNGNAITQLARLAEVFTAHIKAGFIETQKLATDSFSVSSENVTIAGMTIRDYIISVVRNSDLVQPNNVISPIAEVDQTHTNVISPLAQNSAISIKLDNNKFEIFNDHNASGSAVASIDNQGNATFSGSLNSQNLAVNSDATVSGTLHAGKIVADEIEGLAAKVGTLSAQNITNVTNIFFATPSSTLANSNTSGGSQNSSTQQNGLPGPSLGFTDISSYSSFLAYVPNLHATTAQFDNGIMALGPSSLSDTSITGQLSIDGQMIFASNSINVLGADLEIQPLRQGAIAFEGNLVRIDTDGNLTVNGKSYFHNTLYANVISPMAGQNLNVTLGDQLTSDGTDQKFQINNASSSAVFSVNTIGDLVASGAATINKLNLSLVQPALAVSSTESIATGSAGMAQINMHQKEITIKNTLVTEHSLIYITPVGTPDTTSQVPYLLRQVAGESFSVGVPQFTTQPIEFNYLIVN
jgi:hypothetical protein